MDLPGQECVPYGGPDGRLEIGDGLEGEGHLADLVGSDLVILIYVDNKVALIVLLLMQLIYRIRNKRKKRNKEKIVREKVSFVPNSIVPWNKRNIFIKSVEKTSAIKLKIGTKGPKNRIKVPKKCSVERNVFARFERDSFQIARFYFNSEIICTFFLEFCS